MNRFGIETAAHLPDHDALLDAILAFFHKTPGVIGCFLSGSAASGQMDVDSDLDVGVVLESAEGRAKVWEGRWDWQIGDWFHRFDADHIKPHFIIYLFEPAVRVDVNLYLVEDLPPAAGGPYLLAWDTTGALQAWLRESWFSARQLSQVVVAPRSSISRK